MITCPNCGKEVKRKRGQPVSEIKKAMEIILDVQRETIRVQGIIDGLRAQKAELEQKLESAKADLAECRDCAGNAEAANCGGITRLTKANTALEQTVAQLRVELGEAHKAFEVLENGTDSDKSTIRVALKAGRGIGRAAAMLEKVNQEHWSKIFRDEQDELLKENVTLEAERDDLKQQLEEEQGCWQEAIRNEIIRLGIPDNRVDGAGCDSGNPLDLSLAEIGQGIADQLTTLQAAYDGAEQMATHLTAELEERDKACAAMRKALENLYDEQNGPPLMAHQLQWESAMQNAVMALSSTAGEGWKSPAEWERRTKALRDIIESGFRYEAVSNQDLLGSLKRLSDSIDAARRELEDNQ